MAKRLMCVILSVLMIVSLLPTGAFAVDSEETVVELADTPETVVETTDDSDGEEEEADTPTSDDEPVV
ncbi:MAG: hypothetical protein LUG86_07080 [Oscillospiraceae bacterium]|nr:hypothetical protein [Oscillospiraceae bacterium]